VLSMYVCAELRCCPFIRKVPTEIEILFSQLF
jgi:hypothetical protein